jgi:dihydroorotase
MHFERLELPPTADFHAHLRDGALMETLFHNDMIRKGGVDTIYVMVCDRAFLQCLANTRKPNLLPPITTVAAAVSYRERLQRLAPNIHFLITLYLHPSITPDTIAEAARAQISGVKYYPAGVTTNSQEGVSDIEQHFPVLKAMEEHNLVLNLHGEVPNTPPNAVDNSEGEPVTIHNAEARFLPTLQQLHAAFPRLRIVLEHCSTRAALDAVRSCGPTVAATITAHHLWMTVDQCCGDAFSFCKPVAKTIDDRIALVRAVVETGTDKFFFGM